MKAPMLRALAELSISIAQAAEPETLTLACEGTATDKSTGRKICSYTATCVIKPPSPVSMGKCFKENGCGQPRAHSNTPSRLTRASEFQMAQWTGTASFAG
jgi:hypothetical protein